MPPRRSPKSGTFQPQDRYFTEAKQQGFRSRSALKLQQIQKKYPILRRNQTVLDLGAAPGGWSQVALQALGASGQVLAIDLQAISPLKDERFNALQGDLQDPEIHSQVRVLAPQADVVLSDMAPATTGVKFQDQERSAELARQAFKIARDSLKSGGSFVVKVFASQASSELKRELKQTFNQVAEFTPEATRSSSREIYFICRGFH